MQSSFHNDCTDTLLFNTADAFIKHLNSDFVFQFFYFPRMWSIHLSVSCIVK